MLCSIELYVLLMYSYPQQCEVLSSLQSMQQTLKFCNLPNFGCLGVEIIKINNIATKIADKVAKLFL